ncbi:MAG: alanine racemase [Clostridia bacterium]|jgi:alanine racemase|nr:alanine racemase [Clostridia bacterium]MDN5366303.1 alanine racemase [Thermacetogenium sp.]MDN5375314.1 alanine racemase [Thermacetogenium sp.]
MKRPAWIEIDLSALCSNVRELRRVANPSAAVMAVVKANGYGHGLEEVSRAALKSGASWLGVALLQEALALREKGITAPILVLGYTPTEYAEDVVRNDVSQTVTAWEDAVALAAAARRLGKRAKVHIKIDTGMGRLGFYPNRDTLEVICRLARLPGLEVEGIYTHFATADEEDKSYTEEQFARFQCLLKELAARQLFIRWKHCANSAALLDLPFTHLDLVRPGIAIYGYYPSSHVRHDLISLKPVMSLKARLAFVKEVPAGSRISYGGTFVTRQRTRIATVPLGYGDGYSRLLSGKSEVLVKGVRAPVVGRICMDQLMVDVGHIPDVKQGDEVVLLGRQGEEEITAEELAKKLGTISYEVLCMLSVRLPRIYLNGPDSCCRC